MIRKRSRMGQYVRVPIDIENRVETLRLARILEITTELAVLLLLRFMIWADKNADEDRVIAVDICSLDAVVGHPSFSAAATTCDLLFDIGSPDAPKIKITTDLVDSQTFAVRLVEAEKEAERKREARASGGHPPDSRRISKGESSA
jgi:hypothetical protein